MEITLISEETVKVLDRYVFNGAGKLTIRALFAAVMLIVLKEAKDFFAWMWGTAIWMDSDAGFKVIAKVASSNTAATLLLLLVLFGFVCGAIFMATFGLNLMVRLWRRRKRAYSQIVIVWRKKTPLGRIRFAAVLFAAGAMLLSLYVSAVLDIVSHLVKLKVF